METKICSRCETEKDIECFHIRKDTRNGITTVKRRNECKICIAKDRKEYLKNNPDIVKATRKATREKNKDKIKEQYRKWVEKNRDHVRVKTKKYNEEHKDEIKLKRAAFYRANKERLDKWKREHYIRNKAKYRERQNKYDSENKERLLAARRLWENDRLKNDVEYRLQKNLRCRIRVAMKNGNKCQGTAEMIGCSISDFRKHIESMFKEGMSWDNYGKWQIDHKIPISWFNLQNEHCLKAACNFKNMQPLWARENIIKRDRYHEFELIKMTA